MKLNDEAVIALLIVCGFLFFGLIIGGGIYAGAYKNQTIKEAYIKNMECRIEVTKKGSTDFVNNICGEIPKIGEMK